MSEQYKDTVLSRVLIVPNNFKLSLTQTEFGTKKKRPALSVSFVLWNKQLNIFDNQNETKLVVTDTALATLTSTLLGFRSEFSHASAGGVIFNMSWTQKGALNVFSSKKVGTGSNETEIKKGFVNNPLDLHDISMFVLSVLIKLWNRDGIYNHLSPADVLPILSRLNQISLKAKNAHD